MNAAIDLRHDRALAAEARMKTQANKCSACGKSLVGLTPFEKMNFKYCSTTCVKVSFPSHSAVGLLCFQEIELISVFLAKCGAA